MHVVLTANFSPWSRYRGGGQRSAHQLACALAARGHDVTVVFTKTPWEKITVPAKLPYLVEWATLYDFVSRRRAPLRLLSAFSVVRTLRRLSLRRAPSVVHAQGEEGALATDAVDCPLVLTPRYPSYPADLLTASSSRFLGVRSWVRHGKYLALQEAAQRAAFVCPTSRASARLIRHALRVEDARLRVVPNGVDPVFLACVRRPQAHRGPLLFFGRIEREKGIDVLLDAFVRSSFARKLCIVGDGQQLPWLRRAVHARGLQNRVEHRAWASAHALADKLASAAVAVLPSREESFGNAMVEAMAASTPLVTTWAGSLPELVDDGVTGILVPPGEVAQLTQAIDDLLADPARAEALGEEARIRVRERYAWDTVAAQYEQIYREASSSSPASRGW